MLIENLKLFFKQLNTKTENKIARVLFNKSMIISLAESCTGGLVSSRLTDISGSSLYIKENYVIYSNEAKMKILGVSEKTLSRHGAVSEECSREMVQGLFDKVHCDIALATTGFASPACNVDSDNTGLLFVAVKNKNMLKVKRFKFSPNYKRKVMKYLFSQAALEFLLEFLNENDSNKDF